MRTKEEVNEIFEGIAKDVEDFLALKNKAIAECEARGLSGDELAEEVERILKEQGAI